MHIVVTQDDWTALMFASDKSHTAVVELLLKHGADVHAKDEVNNV